MKPTDQRRDSSRSMAHELLLEAYKDDFNRQLTHLVPAQVCGRPPSPSPGWRSVQVPCACSVRECVTSGTASREQVSTSRWQANFT